MPLILFPVDDGQCDVNTVESAEVAEWDKTGHGKRDEHDDADPLLVRLSVHVADWHDW